MLAEARGPLGPVSPWTSSTRGKDVKCPTLQNPGKLQRPGELQRQTSSQKSCFSGVETRQELVWDNWEPGRDFTKTLVLKNIHSNLQKLRCRPPESKFFTTLLPQIILLSPGISFSMPVTFRPLQRREYEDSIEFQGKDGSFQVCLRAAIPCVSLELPESVLLPLCAVQHSSHTTFLFRNASALQTFFHWECTAPFQLSPERGLLKSGQECHINVVFRPQSTLVYQQEACCWFGEEGEEAENQCTVLLQGIAKYPCLQLRNPDNNDEEEQGSPVLHFGSVAVGVSVQKHIDIHNPSPVAASFSLSRLLDGAPSLDSEFSCNLMKGKVAPGASLRATITYTPVVVDTVSIEYLSLTCPGALSKPQLKLTGSCIGPIVSLSSSVVDFGCIEEGGATVRTVELVNSSPAEAVYQWDLDCSGHSVFSIEPAAGTLRPHSQITVKMVYRPTHPIAHHRRVPCLVLHRDPVFLDLIGTCHSDLQQPPILQPKHLVRHQFHRHRRLTQDPPDLSAMQEDHKMQTEQHKMLCRQEEESDWGPDSAAVTESAPMEEYYQACSGGMDPLSSGSLSSLLSPHVTVEPAELLFNHRSSISSSSLSSSSQSVYITNYTSGKLSLVWTAAQDSPFSVSPSSLDLGPLKSSSFRVTYAPQQLNTLHGAQLECFAFYKMREDHQMGDQLLCPPWCVTVRVTGHSFQPGREHFIPHSSLQYPQVVFPALSVLSYRTVLLLNCGDLPLTFHLDPDQSPNPALAESVFVVPSCGLIRPGDHQILTLRTVPTEDSPKEGFSLSLQFNAAKHTQELTVVSTVEKPRVSLEGDGSLYFQPTAVGSCTQRSHHIRNLSRIPLWFQWRIPASDQELIFVEPDAGELQPNESKVQTWSFSPLEETTYTLKPCLTFWPIQAPGCKESYLPLQVMGTGSKGSIEAVNAVLDLGEILVGSCRSIEIPLVNRSLCAVSFCLSVQQTLQDKGFIYDPNTEPNALQLDSVRGSIASHSRMLLRSTVTPHRSAQYQWTISYETLNANGFASSPAQKVCEVRAQGVFPTLQVIDARSSGSVDRLSTVQLWNLFSLDGLNEHLLSNPSPPELTYRTPTRHSLRRCPSVFTTAMLDFNFSAAPLSSDPSIVVLMFHNTGSIPVDWAFLFPEDQQIELEYWAETGEFSSTELHQMKIQDNRLFSISPRSGTLLPSQQRAVHFSYRHDLVGTDRLPVLFKLSHGREILLNFQGVTVERDRPYLHCASNRHVFTPVTIGGFTPPRQVYELYNGGAVPVHYEVDTAPLKQLQADNFNHLVLCCHNPQGDVLPGKTALLEWVFSPLEAKMYHVDVPIHIQGGESMLIRFEGCGFNSRAPGSSGQFNSSAAQSSVPRVQRVPLPGQVVFLSEESVSFGDIPMCSRSSRILFLTNTSHTDTVLYAWELPQQKDQQVVQIHPEQGRLCPGESALLVLTFISSGHPTFNQLYVTCQVTQEAALAQYRDALRRWEEERERQKHEFTLTEDLRDSQDHPVDEEPVAAPVREGPPLRKYKTLPPIRASSSDTIRGTMSGRLTRAEGRAQREVTTVWRRPEPPQPFLLHLGVTARSHGLLEYHTHFPNQLNKHHVFRSLHSKSQRQETASSHRSATLDPQTDGPDKYILTHTLSSLLRSTLDDPALHPCLASIASEPVPHYSHLRGSAPSHRSSSPPSPLNILHTQHSQNVQHTLGTNNLQCSQLPQQLSQLRRESSAQRSVQGSICRSADFIYDMYEEVLLNSLQNLMMEAFLGELILTAHPRIASLPPFSARRAVASGGCKGEQQRRSFEQDPAETLP